MRRFVSHSRRPGAKKCQVFFTPRANTRKTRKRRRRQPAE